MRAKRAKLSFHLYDKQSIILFHLNYHSTLLFTTSFESLRQQDIFSFPIKQETPVGKLFKEMYPSVNDFTNYFIQVSHQLSLLSLFYRFK